MTTHSLTLNCIFDAPTEKLYSAFTSKHAIQSWFGPEGFTIPHAEVEAWPGGNYRYEMHSPTGSVHIVVGKFRELVPYEKISFTWCWLTNDVRGQESLVTVHLSDRAGRTALTLGHTGFASDEERNSHQGGWTSTFESLSQMLAGHPQPVESRITVVGNPLSTYVRWVRMALIEKGISYALDPQEPHSKAVKALNPLGKIPAFRAGDFVLVESSAILRYIDEAFPGPNLMPDTAAERAKVEQWISSINCYCYDPMIRRFLLQFIFPQGPEGTPDREVIDVAIDEMKKLLAMIDSAYGARDFLVGDQLSLADLELAPLIAYLAGHPEGKDVLAPFANVMRGHATISRRASFAQTIPPAF
ncbi:SRPBCC domain-containing protein [Dyella sp. 2HG41-7]|uniref:SRPBCC domain-containing protein n=1 Tax=Dyella sp. 2HG41-7 TaxID=2883239 RepID=UPI001F16474F|nr:SRPBCC domain-containing protein [Dyella sp. 2HG41-7]